MFQFKTSRLLLIALSFMLSNIFLYATPARAQSCPVNFNVTGSITTSDSTQTGSIVRTGTPSNCNGKANPGLNDTNAGRHFDQYTFTNTNATTACVGVTFTGTIDGLHSVAYLNGYNPADVTQNYIGDLGVIYTANTTASYSFSVPAGASFVVVVHETIIPAVTNSYTLTVGCATIPPPNPTVGQVLISEFRASGPGVSSAGSINDEYVELYNNTDVPLSLGSYRIRTYDPNRNGGAVFFYAIPDPTTIPARGHFLLANTSPGATADSYSLVTYAAPDLAFTFSTTQNPGDDGIADNEGIQLTDNGGTTVIDSVGFEGSGGRAGETIEFREGTGLARRATAPPTVQYAYVRKYDSVTGRSIDTNNNVNDFVLVSVTGAAMAGATGTVPTILGAPGPQDLASPRMRNNGQISPSLIEPTQGTTVSPNRVRDLTAVTNGAQGTLSFRRRFSNNSGTRITTLRFRVIDMTTLNTPNSGGAQVDFRALTSGTAVVSPTTSTGVTFVQGTTLEEPPTQALGGGLNSSWSVTLPGGGLASASGGFCQQGSTCSVNVQFLLGVNGAGRFRFFIFQEVLP